MKLKLKPFAVCRVFRPTGDYKGILTQKHIIYPETVVSLPEYRRQTRKVG
jgi:hypothetical protein